MPDNAQSKIGAVEFIDFHKPGLTAGDYEISVIQKIDTTDQKIADAVFTTDLHGPNGHSLPRKFTVAGERFELKPTDIHSVFPPDGNLGEHSNVLPHIILNRSTLPWERRPEENTPGAEEKIGDTPWLALLLFDDSEKPLPLLAHLTFADPKNPIIKLLDESKEPAKAAKFPKLLPKKTPSSDANTLELESGQHDRDMLTVIDVKKSLLESLMPQWEDLKLLAHVRQGTDPEEDPTGDELAVIISNRLPRAGRTSTAHLVSIEARFKKASGQYAFDYQDAGQDDLIRLVSLKSWSFACADQKQSFKGLLLNLNEQGATLSTLRLPASAIVKENATAEKFLSTGYVLVPHNLHRGDKTASWYHGPLVPCETRAPEITLPIRTADELVRYDPAIGMFDVSYAAAWELGRLLSLQNKSFSTSLFQWKRRYAQQLAQAEQLVTHLPFQGAGSTAAPPPPPAVSSWFESLRKLQGVPFDYLVPDERMLPVESIRFFRMDDAWVRCLLDGAFSIGRVTSADHERDQSLEQTSPATNSSEHVAGVLLRSEVVSGWPGLLVDAYSDPAEDPPESSRLKLLRMERLSANVLICLFEGEMKRVDIHQKPETLHFGLDRNTKEEKETKKTHSDFYKTLRDPNSGAVLEPEVEVEIDGSHWRSVEERSLSLSALAQSLKDKLGNRSPSPFTSAQFAMQMVEGVQKIIFISNPAAV
jgi:hypothetical protein